MDPVMEGRKRPREQDSGAAAASKRKHKWAQKTRKHKFDTEPSDHAETPQAAYIDIQPFLEATGKSLKKTKRDLVIYDPYYCDGGVVTRMKSLGFRVLNANEDCYMVWKRGAEPKYDVLMTNPPYSQDHLERIVEHCASSGRPFCLLVPSYVLGRVYWQTAAATLSQHGSSPFFVCPHRRYSYEPPAWASDAFATSPFPSMWFCWHPEPPVPRQANFKPQRVQIFWEADDVPSEQRDITDPKKKRPNPKARKRLKQKRAQLAAGYSAP